MSGIEQYDRNNLYFVYPSNWSIDESEMETPEGTVQLSNGGGAFWLLKKYPFGTNPDDVARSVIKIMQQEYDDIEIDRFDKIVFDKNITGFEMTFFYLDLMNSAQVLCFEQDGIMYAVFWQTGNQLIILPEEDAPTDRVLEAITLSLLKGEPAA
ncbi:MAG: hypothetical protein LBN39_08650 [Planctomycetaceae bacterium]|jgi:hypothetical protein|nr:hypothetical protein [Planctomycetaceae bacterium]